MNMYISNPNLPRVRMDAVRLVRSGQSVRQVARHFGFSHSAIVKWTQRAPRDGRKNIPTRSCRPHHHAHALSPDLVRAIIAYRIHYHRCAFFLHHMLQRDGYIVSLSSVKRALRRRQMTYPSPWKKWHTYPPRPTPTRPGILMETDTIHDGAPAERLYVYVLLDVYSRWAYAAATSHITTHRSLHFIERAQTRAPFPFTTIQSDHGSEFSKWFTKRLAERGLAHRHSRIRTPNDNAHIERFNRTLQDECLSRLNRNLRAWQRGIPEYLHYYNAERPHMGLGMKTPLEVVPSS